MADATSLKDAHVVVTGAGRGLGAALALVLSDLGCNLILCGRSLEALDVTANHIQSRTGRTPAKVLLDLADAASVEKAAEEIRQNFPVIDILINNGAMYLHQRETPYSADEVMGVVNSAVTGTFLFTQALLPALEKSNRPDIVIIGSVSGLLNVGLFGVSVPFYAAKHGQSALADGLRQMLVGTPVRSICIHPPWLKDISPLEPEWDATLAKGEMVTTRDIVDAVIFAVTRPRNVTIASIVIDSDSKGIDAATHSS